MKTANMTGKQFGSWLVLDSAGRSAGLARIDLWKCKCDCGVVSVVYGTALRSGKSAGCITCAAKKISKARVTHGRSRNDPTYISWKAMKNRCGCETSPDYPLYGGRGIRVSARWEEFENFVEDMGNRPPGTSLDRLELDDDYHQENCRWATPIEQANNKRNNHVVELDGVSMTISEFARVAGIDRRTARYRLVDKGMTPAEIVTVTKKAGTSTISET